MKAFVNQDTCIGCGLCCGMCEEVFRMNDDDKAEAYGQVDEGNKADVQAAIDGCPVSAISWDD